MRKRGAISNKKLIKAVIGDRLIKLEKKIRKGLKRQAATSEIYSLTVRMNNLRAELKYL